MNIASGDRQGYLDAFRRLEREAPANGRGWLAPIRGAAMERFADLGFPTQKEEAWRFTSLQALTQIPFAPAGAGRREGLTPETLERLTFEPWDCTHLVFVNGRYEPALSRLRDLPRGVVVRSLAEAFSTSREAIEPHLGRLADSRTQPFTALNTAFLHDGAFVALPEGVALEEPIHLLFVSTAETGAPTVSHPRVLIVAGERSQLTVVESFVGLGDEVYFTNGITEIVAGDGAIVDHYRLQRESSGAFHVARVQVELGRDSRFTSHAIALGGRLVRNDVGVLFGAEGGDCTLNGLYVTGGRQLIDNHTVIDHARPHGSSRELYKGVLDDASRAVFDGLIVVRPEAQKTDAQQENRNLLLSEDALVDTKPTLQIHADDVKCKHAATIGQLDEDALFYLRSRGLGQEAARNLMIHAFVNDILDRIKIAPVRAGLECLMFTQLKKHRPGRV